MDLKFMDCENSNYHTCLFFHMKFTGIKQLFKNYSSINEKYLKYYGKVLHFISFAMLYIIKLADILFSFVMRNSASCRVESLNRRIHVSIICRYKSIHGFRYCGMNHFNMR